MTSLMAYLTTPWVLVLVLIIGFVLLVKGADWLVDGASALAKRFGISDLVIGLTVVAFGTSMPEFVVNMVSVADGATDLAITNILGSNIINTLVILGFTALVYPVVVSQRHTRNFDIPMSIIAGVCVFAAIVVPSPFGEEGQGITRLGGIILLLLFIVFLYNTFRHAKDNPDEVDKINYVPMPFWKPVCWILFGLAGLVIGGEMIVKSAVQIAIGMGVSQAVIGLTIVALGTSLPELATSVIAATKKNSDIAMGNVIGSNIFNVFFVLGASATVHPLPSYHGIVLDAWFAALASVLVWLFVMTNKQREIKRWEGAILVMVYVIYLIYRIFTPSASPNTWEKDACWIGVEAEEQTYVDSVGHSCLPARYLKKEFDVEQHITGAYLYVASGGYSDCWLNEMPVSDEVMGPLPTNFDRTVYYRRYDVTPLIRRGHNELTARVASGYFTAMLTRYRMPSWGTPRLKACLEIYTNQNVRRIMTDATWLASDQGPIRLSNLYDGETYDARQEHILWRQADILPEMKGQLLPQDAPGMVRIDTLQPIRIWQEEGKVLVDMGLNMVGWLQLSAKGQAGHPVTIRTAEALTPDGKHIYTDNLRLARCCNTYIPADTLPFTYCPSTVYQGFRYAEIVGLSEMPDSSSIQGIIIGDKMATTGMFTCSDSLLNQLFRAAYHGIQGNYHGFPTDCPQRDERLGWLGDRMTGCYGESMIFDNKTIYLKWLQDIEDTQSEDGQIADIAPEYWTGLRHANVTWTGTYVSVANMLWERYGCEQGIRRHYPSMRKWLQYTLKTSMRDDLMTIDTYGDWCMPPENLTIIHSKDPARQTSDTVLSTCAMYDVLQKMQRFATLLGKDDDCKEYAELAERMKTAYNHTFYHPETGGYSNQTVTANILSYALGLVPEEERNRVLQQIVKTTEQEFDSHVSCGVLGIQHLMRTLTRNGHSDLAFRIATQTTYPSWGYMLRNGATTIWELWNGNTADPAMNSGNHVMLLGDLMLWYFEDLAGIRPDKIGYEHLLMKPCFPQALNYVEASYQSVRGRIRSRWDRQNNGTIRWQITLPASVRATVVLPDGSTKEIVGSTELVF